MSEFNYAPYVQKMKDKGVRWVQFLGAYQQAAKLAQTMKEQGFHPDAYVLDPTAYTPDYIKLANGSAEGTFLFVNFTPFEEASNNKELQLYTSWLQQVHPGAQPTFFGLFAWSASRLFVEQAAALGGRLSRASLARTASRRSTTGPETVCTHPSTSAPRTSATAGGSCRSRAASSLRWAAPNTSATATRHWDDLMDSFIGYTITGIFTGAAYAIAASGLVLTYSTTRVFNVAHGAFGMVMAFLYWDLSQRQGIPLWIAFLLMVFVIAPLFGILVQRFVARGLGEAPVSVSLVVTVGLLVLLIGLAQFVWPPEPRSIPLVLRGQRRPRRRLLHHLAPTAHRCSSPCSSRAPSTGC